MLENDARVSSSNSTQLMSTQRPDNRAFNELRPLSVRFGVINGANGSAEVAFGGTSVVASVHGPVGAKGRHEQIDRTTIKVTVESFSSAPSKSAGSFFVIVNKRAFDNFIPF